MKYKTIPSTFWSFKLFSLSWLYSIRSTFRIQSLMTKLNRFAICWCSSHDDSVKTNFKFVQFEWKKVMLSLCWRQPNVYLFLYVVTMRVKTMTQLNDTAWLIMFLFSPSFLFYVINSNTYPNAYLMLVLYYNIHVYISSIFSWFD